MTNTLTFQPKRGRGISLKRSLTTVSSSNCDNIFAKKPVKGSSLAFSKPHSHSRGQSITKSRTTILDLLALSGSSSDGESEDDNDQVGHLQSPTQNRTSLKRHVSLMSFPLTRTEIKASTCNTLSTLTNCVLDQTGFKFNSNVNTLQPSNNNIPTIEVETLHLIMNEYQLKIDKFCKDLFHDLIIVDCRFPFEFKGGHIDGAINITTINELEDLFFNDETNKLSPLEFTKSKRTLVIFHCEFSSMRGPLRANQLRDLDRQHSGNDNYPNLYYPDILILQGGYKHYFDSLLVKNDHGYIEMDHPKFEQEREKGLTLLRQESRNSLKRC